MRKPLVSRAAFGPALRIAVALSATIALASCATVDLGAAVLGEIQDLGNGKLAFRGSTLDRSGPIPVLELSGSPYERGFAYGVLLRDEVRRANAVVLELKEDMLSRYSWIERTFAPSVIWRELEEFMRATPEAYVQEAKGLAEAAGIPFGDILFAQAGAGLFACTSALSRSDAGSVLHGRNFDYWPRAIGETPVLVRYADPDGVPYWNLSAVGYLPSFNGWNDEGIAMTLNAGGPGEEAEGYVPTGWKLREALSRSRTLSDAKAYLGSTPCDGQTWVITASSAQEGSGAVFDLSGDDRAVFAWKGGKPLVVLNRAFGDGRHESDGLSKKRLSLLKAFDEFNVERSKAAERFLASGSPSTPAAMWALLRDRSFPIPDLYATGNGTIANENTLMSMVFDLGYGAVYVATGRSWAALRDVWRFDPYRKSFARFLEADPFVRTPGFESFERAMIAYEDGPLPGKPYPEPPVNPYLAGWYASDAESERRALAELEAAAAAYPQAPWPRVLLGYHLPDGRRADAIAHLEAALAVPWIAPTYRLYALAQLARLRAASGDPRGASGAAREWLALVAKYEPTYSTDGWIDDYRAEMERLAGK
jgi:hypothetical protein